MKHNKKTICKQASVFYYDYIQNTELCTAKPEIFHHMKECTYCRSEIGKLKDILAETTTEDVSYKEKRVSIVLDSHFALANREVTCGDVKEFIPGLAGLLSDIRILTPVTTHIGNCSLCRHDLDAIVRLELTSEQLANLEQIIISQKAGRNGGFEFSSDMINETISSNKDISAVLKNFLEREESGIVTEYIIKEPTGSKSSSNFHSDYNDCDVRIVVRNLKSQTADEASLSHNRLGRNNLIRQLAKPLSAIAAAVLIATWIFVGTFAKAIELDDIYKAVGNVQNICMTIGTSGDSEISQRVWVSEDLNVKVFYSANQWVLWDIQNKVKRSLTDKSKNLKTVNLNNTEIMDVKQTMDVSLTLLPFKNLSLLPSSHNWELLADEEIPTKLPDTQIYDLSWSSKTANGALVYYKWRSYIDKDTSLPKRIENWQKYSLSEEYVLKNWIDITYPEGYEIEELARKISLAAIK
ncbi:MAG: hypothetical protein JXK07_16720 [Spirochaetes bacterium]|nr:hypothetical protein [Spirochaetota bacterium]